MQIEHYEELAALENWYWWFQVRFRLAAQLLFNESRVRHSGIIMDWGCGTGGFLEYLNRAHAVPRSRMLGMEPSPSACKILQTKGIPHCRPSPTGSPPPGRLTEPPAAVVMLDVLEHVEDPVKTLTQLRQLSADDARLVVLVPAFSHLWSQWDECLGHLRRYRKKDIRDELHAAGWITREARYFFASMYPVSLLRKRLIADGRLSAFQFPRIPRTLNRILTTSLSLESRLGRLPVGTSLAVAANAR